MAAESTWGIEGDYFEGCNCQVACPCVFLSDPNEGACDVSSAWHIDRGRFGSVSLDGLNVVTLVHTPGNMATGPKWQIALYLDDRASPEQSEALTKIYAGQAGGFFAVVASTFIGEVLGVRSVPIEFHMDGKRRRLTVPGTVTLEIEAIKGADESRDVIVSNAPLGFVPAADAVLSRSTRYSYKDYQREWDTSGKNGFYMRFAYSG